jgi:hypothetical protein
MMMMIGDVGTIQKIIRATITLWSVFILRSTPSAYYSYGV